LAFRQTIRARRIQRITLQSTDVKDDFPSCSTCQRFRDLGGLQDRRRSGRPRTARTPKVVEAVRKEIARNATRSISTMARDMGISRKSVERRSSTYSRCNLTSIPVLQAVSALNGVDVAVQTLTQNTGLVDLAFRRTIHARRIQRITLQSTDVKDDFPSCSTCQRFRNLGGLQDRRRSGRPRTARTPEVVEAVRKEIARNATRSISTMARDMGISRKSVERRAGRAGEAAILSASNQEARVKKCRQLLLRTRNKGQHLSVFSDEKLFTVEQQVNAQNVGVIARNAEKANKERNRSSGRSLCPSHGLGRDCASGKAPLIFVVPGVKIDKDSYLKTILEDALLRWRIPTSMAARGHSSKIRRPHTRPRSSKRGARANSLTSSRQKNGRHRHWV
uniref:HTH_Tnp_Tc3_2 domain-containing protein n=1 Tax=Haemonchus placei TaxID=6290 RepID=A0A0N4XA94_HAEPC